MAKLREILFFLPTDVKFKGEKRERESKHIITYAGFGQQG
jgi:hypothetical protein